MAKMVDDPEIMAIATINDLLQELEESARQRVIHYLTRRYQDIVTAPPLQQTGHCKAVPLSPHSFKVSPNEPRIG